MDKQLNILIAPDSFKESLTALQAAEAIEKGFMKVFPHAYYKKIPMADGGEGTVQSIVDATKGKIIDKKVTGPLNTPVNAFYGISGDKSLAIIEMAASSGLELLDKKERDPLKTTTYGVGELIEDALNRDVEEILLGIDGSATNDGGAGMIQALGGRLLDEKGEQIEPTGKGLEQLRSIDLSQLQEGISKVNFRVACDVDNPLTGETGASYIFGPQKGADDKQVEYLDQNLKKYAEIIKRDLKKDVEQIPGSGAAGGLGAGLLAAFDSELVRGGAFLADILNVEKAVKECDLVITGEGGINDQTAYGKTPVAISKIAQEYNVPVICLAGTVSDDYEVIFEMGIDAVFPIIHELAPLKNTLEEGENNLIRTSENIARLLNVSIH